jgi:hypothetical protein
MCASLTNSNNVSNRCGRCDQCVDKIIKHTHIHADDMYKYRLDPSSVYCDTCIYCAFVHPFQIWYDEDNELRVLTRWYGYQTPDSYERHLNSSSHNQNVRSIPPF